MSNWNNKECLIKVKEAVILIWFEEWTSGLKSFLYKSTLYGTMYIQVYWWSSAKTQSFKVKFCSVNLSNSQVIFFEKPLLLDHNNFVELNWLTRSKHIDTVKVLVCLCYEAHHDDVGEAPANHYDENKDNDTQADNVGGYSLQVLSCHLPVRIRVDWVGNCTVMLSGWI